MPNLPLQNPDFEVEPIEIKPLENGTNPDIANSSSQFTDSKKSTDEASPVPAITPGEVISKRSNRTNIAILVTILISVLALMIGLVQVFAPSFFKPSNLIFGTKAAVSSSSSMASSLKVMSSSSSSQAFSANSNEKVDVNDFYSSSVSVLISSVTTINSSQNQTSQTNQASKPTASSINQPQSIATSKPIIENEILPVIGSPNLVPTNLSCSADSNSNNQPQNCFVSFQDTIGPGTLIDPKLIIAPAGNKVTSPNQTLNCSRTLEDPNNRTLTCENKKVALPVGNYSYYFENNNKIVKVNGSYQVK